MSKPPRARSFATARDLLSLPEGTRFHEVVAGELVRKAAPSGEHGAAQAALAGSLFGPFSRPPGGRFPGGWWFETEVEIELETHEVYRPDVVGWRREHAPQRPGGTPIRLLPDGVCEILSASNAKDDQVTKSRPTVVAASRTTGSPIRRSSRFACSAGRPTATWSP